MPCETVKKKKCFVFFAILHFYFCLPKNICFFVCKNGNKLGVNSAQLRNQKRLIISVFFSKKSALKIYYYFFKQ